MPRNDHDHLETSKTDSNATRLNRLVQAMPEVISEHDAETRFLFATPACSNIFGKSTSELETCKLIDFVHEEERDQIGKLFNGSWDPLIPRLAHFRLCIPGQDDCWVETTLRPTDGGTFVAVTRQVSWRTCSLKQKSICEHEAVAELNARFKSVIESPKNISIIMMDREGRILLQNNVFRDGALERLGVDVQLGDRVLDMIPTQRLRNRYLDSFERALEGEAVSRDFELENDEKLVAFNVTYSPVVVDEKGIVGVTLFVQDISVRTQLERDLKEKADSYSLLLDGIDEGIGITDESENILYMNPAGARIFGCEHEDMIGHNLLSFIPTTVHKSIQDQTTLRQENISSSYEHEILTPQGDHKTLLVSAAPQQTDNGGVRTFAVFRDVTDIRRAEHDLLAAGERFKAVFEYASDAMCILDLESDRVLEANAVMCELSGYSIDELRQLRPEDVSPEWHHDDIKVFREVLARDHHYAFDMVMKPRSGELIKLEANASYVTSGGKFVILLAARDMRERRKAQEALIASEKRLKDMFDLSPDAIFVAVASTGLMVNANPAACELTGYSLEELKTMTQSDLHPDPEQAAIFGSFLKGELDESAPIEAKFLHKNGRWIPIEVRARRIEIDGALHVLATFRDMSLRYQEQELNRFQSQLLNAVQQAVIATDLRGRITYWNGYAERLYGWKAREVRGQLITRVLPDQELPGQTFAIVRNLKPGQSWTGEVTLKRRDGSDLPLLASTSPVFGLKGKLIGTLGVTTDITTRKNFERSLKQARKTAEEASAAKSIFLANMSHEIRTPMNSILGFTELITEMIKDIRQLEYLDAIKISANSLMQLINDILDLSRIEAGRMRIDPKPVRPKDILNDIRNIFLMNAQSKNLEFTILLDEETPKVIVIDEVRLRQILINLIGNAIKFTKHGFVSVSLKPISKQDENSNVDLRLTVSDSGVGIPADEQEKIFQAFVQVEKQDQREFGGTGLGLAITSSLVHMMGGNIQLVSTPGSGSSFIVDLTGVATLEEIGQDEEQKQREIATIRFAPARVLLMEDESLNRRLIREFLNDQPIDLVEAVDGEKGLAEARQHRPDLILLDLRMPVMDGYEALLHLKRENSLMDVPVIVLSASLLEQEESRALESGAAMFIRKPISRYQLIESMSQYLPTVPLKNSSEQ
jgi:PAS domain S-box-containing protein